MKHKMWLFSVPISILFSFLFWVTETGFQGELQNPFLRDKLFPVLKGYSGWFTNIKFKVRGPVEPKSKIVIIEIDSRSIEQFGRWPWHRDLTSQLIDAAFTAGAKVVGLDMVFSEPDQRVPDPLRMLLEQNKQGHLIPEFETDSKMTDTIAKYKDKLVVGWTSEYICQPAYGVTECPASDPEVVQSFPEGYSKFGIEPKRFKFDQTNTPLLSLLNFIPNLSDFSAQATHAGFFNASPDPDGYIRRSNLVMAANGTLYKSLALEMASIALNEEVVATLKDSTRLESIVFAKSQREIPISPLGVMEINFRGPGNTFPYVRAMDLLNPPLPGEKFAYTRGNREIASTGPTELLKDAIVLIGVTALGVFDMRAFPFDSNVAGVEGHANILDNLLNNDMLVHQRSQNDSLIIFVLMTLGAFLFAYLIERLESVAALGVFVVFFFAIGYFDSHALFLNNINWNTSLLATEFVAVFMIIIAVKYVIEERNKKFIKGAFSKYVAPAVVDSILKDPTKLSVGGVKKELTIVFSDIRSFTTFSEKLDAQELARFLNDYLGIMTDIVFEYGGTLDKYIGDAVMAFWGAPLDQPDHAINACLAAIKMQQVLAQHRDRYLKEFNVPVTIGIGINSGNVNVGNMGSSKIFEYTVIGDHVNLASRLEGLTKPYHSGILTTRFTFDCIQSVNKPLPIHRVLDMVKVKGKKKAVEIIQILETDFSDEALKTFNKARELYTAQKWDEAIVAFKSANDLAKKGNSNPEYQDEMAIEFIQRCEDFKMNLPGPDWDGAWEMTSK